jgi:copper chaperone CopZ
MKKIFKLEGLGCANCAAKMEKAIGKLDGVNSASVNFLTTKLVIEAEDGRMDQIVDAARTIIKKIEPDVVMTGPAVR